MTASNETGPLNIKHHYFPSDVAVLAACKAGGLTVIKHGKSWIITGQGVRVQVSNLRAVTVQDLEPLAASPQAVRRSRHA